MADWPPKNHSSASEKLSAPAISKTGRIRLAANNHIPTACAQVPDRRDPARDQRQFPRAVRFLPVRLLRPGYRKGVFPAQNDTAALLNAYGVFWLGALMRPVGAIVLGSYIDRIGRRQGLIVTLALMALGTVVIAFCPSYAAIGVAAPIIVLLGRLIQGFRPASSSAASLSIFPRSPHPAIAAFILRSNRPASRSRSLLQRPSASFWRSHSRRYFPGSAGRNRQMAHPILYRVHHHPRHLHVAPVARGNAGLLAMKKHPTAARYSPRRSRTGAFRSRHDDRRADHDHLLFHHGVRTWLRQATQPIADRDIAGDASRRGDKLHLESGRRCGI